MLRDRDVIVKICLGGGVLCFICHVICSIVLLLLQLPSAQPDVIEDVVHCPELLIKYILEEERSMCIYFYGNDDPWMSAELVRERSLARFAKEFPH